MTDSVKSAIWPKASNLVRARRVRGFSGPKDSKDPRTNAHSFLQKIKGVYGWIFSRWIFFPKVVTFFSTSSAVFYHFWHWFTCFDRYFLSIMSAGVAKTNFWTCHLMKTTWKPPLNTGDFEVFTHFYSFCTSLLCFQIKLNPSRTLVFYVYHVWKLFSSFVSLSFYHL